MFITIFEKNMKAIISLLSVGLLLFTGCSPKVSKNGAKTNELKVMTYNIHHANPPSKIDFIDIDAIVNVIKKEKPDLVALQELDKHVSRSGNVDQAKEIAAKLGMNYRFFKGIDYQGGEYGVAIFSRYKIENPKQIRLPQKDPKAEARTLGYAEFTLGNGKKVAFATTHLGVDSEESRVMQVAAIQNEFRSVSYPIILTGDLNSMQGSKSITLLQQQFKNSCTDNCGLTSPAVKPRRNIDYILTKNADWSVKDYRVVDETYASDHRPVVATFIMK